MEQHSTRKVRISGVRLNNAAVEYLGERNPRPTQRSVISASDTHVVEGVASVGNTLTSLVKKL
jgi:hypothetical protein